MDSKNLLLLTLIEQKDYQSASFFATKLGVSRKTIYRYLDELAINLSNQELQLSKLPRNGILLKGSSENKEELRLKILNGLKKEHSCYSLTYRRLFLFSRLLFRKKIRTYQEYAEAFFVSVQSIKNDFDGIIDFLSKHQIDGIRERHSFSLIGNEVEIEHAFKSYLESYQEKNSLSSKQKEEIFDDKILQVVASFMQRIYMVSIYHPNDYLVDSLENSLVIALNRLRVEQHFPDETSLLFDKLENMQFYLMVLDFSDEIQENIGISLSSSDIYYICSLLLVHGIEPSLKDFEQQKDAHEAVIQLIEEMSHLVNCDFTKDEHLYRSLMTHVIPMIYRLQIGVRVKNPLREKIMQQYATMDTLVSYGVRQLAQNFLIQITEDEISFLTIHFQLAFEKVQSVKHLLIVCPEGLGTSQLVYQKIKNHLPDNNVIETANFKDLQRIDLSKVDLLVSTVSLEGSSLPVVYVSSLPTNSELALVDKHLRNLERNEKTFVPKRLQEKKLIKLVLDEKFIYLKKKVPDMGSVIHFLAEDLEKKGIVTNAFQEAVFRRENMGTTGLSSGIAIPHADPATVLKSKIAIVTLTQKIFWGKSKVSVVILLALAEKDMSWAKDMIASIYELLMSSSTAVELSACNTSEEVKQLMTSFKTFEEKKDDGIL